MQVRSRYLDFWINSAFDTVDHQILFDRLQFSYGFEGAVLGWFRSYLTGRSQYIRYNGVQSESTPVLYGVPQGSVLGPVLFILYSADVIDIATKHGFFAHSYADDLQIYDHSSQTTCLNLVPRMSACIEEISTWMASNRLKLNPSKTEVIWLGSLRRLKHCPMASSLPCISHLASFLIIIIIIIQLVLLAMFQQRTINYCPKTILMQGGRAVGVH